MSNFSESKESFSSSASELPVKRTETKEINQDGEQDLLKQIQEIKNLPSEAVANRYLFWDSKEAGESKKTLSREKAASVLDLLNETNDFEESIDEEKAKQYLGRFFNKNFSGLNYTVNTLRNWCSENPDNIKIINEEVINALNKGAEVSLPLLYLLSELSMYRQDPLLVDGGKPIENLSNALNNGTFSLMPEFFDQLAVLGRVENKKANLKLHKILDFIRDFMEDCQNFEGGSDNLFDACEKFSAMEKDKSKNYLLKKHFEEISEMRNVVRPDKKDVIKDLTGGATDQVIYTYRNLVESQQNKMRLGINQGFPVRNPVLPISNGIFGLYDKGKLIEIFKDDDVDFSDREKKYIKNNKPEYDYIYKAINKNGNLPRDFEAYEKARNGEFYFDTSRLTDVDPVVLGIILTSNQMYIHAVEGHNNKIELLSKDEFYKELFPLKNYSAEKAYGYEYLLSLSMRKKIEDDFGLKIEELGLAEQRNFLTFLERASVDKAKDLQGFVKHFGHNGLKSFLSLEYGEEYGEVLLDLDNSEYLTTEQAKKIFKEYNALNERALIVAKRIKQSRFFEEIELTPEIAEIFVEQFSEAILRRAKDILNTAQAIAKNGKAETQFYAKGMIECDDPKEVIESLKIYNEMLVKLECLLQPKEADKKFQLKLTKIDRDQIPEIYDFEVTDAKTKKVSYLAVQLREQGAALGEHNKDLEFNGEARINILTHNKEIGKKLSEPSRQNALSARLDLEGIVRLDGEIIANDPTKGRELSWEVGFIGEKKSSLAGDVIGRVMAIGNALGQGRKNTGSKDYPEYYHNRESFTQELGNPEVFAKIVQFIRRQIEGAYEVE